MELAMGDKTTVGGDNVGPLNMILAGKIRNNEGITIYGCWGQTGAGTQWYFPANQPTNQQPAPLC